MTAPTARPRCRSPRRRRRLLLPQRPQPERLAYDEPVQRQRKHQRVALGLFQQFLELVDDHIGEFAAGVIAVHLRAGIVQFHRVGDR